MTASEERVALEEKIKTVEEKLKGAEENNTVKTLLFIAGLAKTIETSILVCIKEETRFPFYQRAQSKLLKFSSCLLHFF